MKVKTYRYAIFVYAILICGYSIFSPAPGWCQTVCEGIWRVSIETQAGVACNPNQSHRVKVDGNGVITEVNPSSVYRFRGFVVGCKTVSFKITREGEISEGQGQVIGETASGVWRVTAPASKVCSGTWFARHRDD
jgi:hypothetical protein